MKTRMAIDFDKTPLGLRPMDEAANEGFEAIFSENWERVYEVIYRLVGDGPEAEALALEVFWRFYQRSPAFDHPAKLRGWLYRVATNLGYNALRAQKRRHHYERVAGSEALRATASGDPPGEALRREQQSLVREILKQMKPKSARLLILRYSGLSYREIAEALALKPGSVGKMLARAEEEFARRYRKLEGGD